MNKLNHPVKGLGEISVRVHDLDVMQTDNLFAVEVEDKNLHRDPL